MPQMFSAYAGCLPILFICLIPVTYLAVSWQFTLALVIDKNWSFGTAMKTSWQRVNQHWWQVFRVDDPGRLDWNHWRIRLRHWCPVHHSHWIWHYDVRL